MEQIYTTREDTEEREYARPGVCACTALEKA